MKYYQVIMNLSNEKLFINEFKKHLDISAIFNSKK